MKIRSVLAVAVAVASLSASTLAYAEAPVNTPALTYVGFAKTKTIKFSLRNDSSAAMELKVGDNVMTIDAGKTVAVNLPVGTRIVSNTATPTHPAGTLVAQVSNQLNDVTIAIK